VLHCFLVVTERVVAAVLFVLANERAAIAMGFLWGGHHRIKTWCALE